MRYGFILEVNEIGFNSAVLCMLVCAASLVILRELGFRGAPVVAAFVITAALSLYSGELTGAVGILKSSFPGELGETVKTVAKALGIGYISGVSQDITRELGEGGIAKCIAVITKIELTVLAVPYVEEILLAANQLMGN